MFATGAFPDGVFVSSKMTTIEKPSIAVVLPVYNVEPYLRECVDSILAQTYKNFTVFAVDDGATDGSGKILDDYAIKDSRFVVIHKKNGGLSDARNAALTLIEKRREYDFIAFIDSDDKVNPEFLEHLVNSANKNNSDITLCGYYVFNNDGRSKIFGSLTGPQEITREDFVEIIFSFNRWRGVCCSGGMVWKSLFKASVVEKIRFPSDRDINEDEIFCLQAAINAKSFYYTSEALYWYRQRVESLVHDEKFAWKLLRCRELCLPISEKISPKASLVVKIAYVTLVIDMTKRSNKLLNIDISKYKNLVADAYENGFVTRKFLSNYNLLCGNRFMAKGYLLIRGIFQKISFWKKRYDLKNVEI